MTGWGVMLAAASLPRPAVAVEVEALLPQPAAPLQRAAVRWWETVDEGEAEAQAARLAWSIARLDTRVLETLSEAADSASPPLRAAPAARAVLWQGRAVRVRSSALPPPLANVLEIRHLHRIDAIDDQGRKTRILATAVPAAWLNAIALDERITVTGIEIAEPEEAEEADGAEESNGSDGAGGRGVDVSQEDVSQESGADPDTLLIANRIRWFPDADSALPALPRGWRLLASERVDVGLLERVGQRDRQPLSARDSEPFYGVLGAAGRLAGRSDSLEPAERMSVIDLLKDSRPRSGQRLRIDVETARLVRVEVTEPEVAARLGTDHYWQIDCFAELPNVRIELAPLQSGDAPLVFEHRFPVTLAVAALPPWLAEEVQAEGGESTAMRMLRRAVTVDGFFYRLWSYDSQYVTSRGGGRQISPLILARTIDPAAERGVSPVSVALIGWIAAGGFLLALMATIALLWYSGRHDRLAAQRRRKAQTPPRLHSLWDPNERSSVRRRRDSD